MILSDNARRLVLATTVAIDEAVMPTEEEIRSLAAEFRNITRYTVSDDEFELVLRSLHQKLRIDMGIGSRVINDQTPWVQARKSSIDPFYWTRYQGNLRKEGLPPKVVLSLDKVTDEVLDLSGNPATNNGWPRRGLVMGDVQSGKTSNYTGLICKAADAGYRLIILLTGTLESLRRQTQERLDAGFVGLDSSGVVTRNRRRSEIGVGLIDSSRSAGVFTSTLQDFNANTMNQLGFRLQAFNEPILLVVKKNRRILENLTAWLRTYNSDMNGHIDLPMMLIDDEADNASVNTAPERITAINAAIRGLLTIFPRSTYIGFTATPFANVFIDPETTDDMCGDNLFPRDFVYALDPPTNYLGAAKIFGEDSKVDCLRWITDAENYFPAGHRASHQVEGLPPSLVTALYAFMLANAIMDLRIDVPKHRSMLVNVSHFTDVQGQIKEEIDALLRQIQEDIRNYASLSTQEALNISKTLRELHELFKFEYSDVGTTWDDIQAVLTKAVLPIQVRSINQRSGAASLAYADYSQDGLRVIAVGGNSLARGLTLEGLCISYFYRSTAMYDTLLQMGRWFGYRSNYEDLVRIWMTESTANWYGQIAEASEELRSDIKHMQNSGLKPIDFGMKVRASPEALLITARNKMRHAAEITRLVSVGGEGLETPRLVSDKSIIAANFKVASELVTHLLSSGAHRIDDNANPLWTSVDKRLVIEVLKNFVVHPINVTFHPVDLARFLEESIDPKLDKWDIVIPNGSSQQLTIASGLDIKLQQRNLEINVDRRYVLVSGKRMRVGSRGVEKEGMSDREREAAERIFRENPENKDKRNVSDKAYRMLRSRPLLILHFLEGTYVDPNLEGEQKFEVPSGMALTALGLSFPQLSTQTARVIYRINLVEIRNLASPEEIEIDDDEVDYEEN